MNTHDISLQRTSCTYSVTLNVAEEVDDKSFLPVVLRGTDIHENLFNSPDQTSQTGIEEYSSANQKRKVCIVTDQAEGKLAIRKESSLHGSVLIEEYILDKKLKQLTITASGDGHRNLLAFRFRNMLNDLAEAGFFAEDGNFSCADTLNVIRRDDLDLWDKLLRNRKALKLPVICIVPSICGWDPEKLTPFAQSLKGVAHFITFENREVYHKLFPKKANLREEILFFPPSCPKPVSLGHLHKMNPRQLMDTIATCFIQANVKSQTYFFEIKDKVRKEQWTNMQSILVVEKEKRQKAEVDIATYLENRDQEFKHLQELALEKALTEADSIVSSYEEDILELKDELYEKSMLLQGLQVENQHLKDHSGSDKIAALYMGEEKGFYQKEVQELLLSVLEDSLEYLPEKSRKRDIVTDILASNNYQHLAKNRAEKVKSLLKSYEGMTVKVKHDLKELGFTIEEGRKHCKIFYYGDQRYLAVFGSTPSDMRCGKNNALLLTKMAY